MINIGFAILLWLTSGPAAIGHDIEVMWVKGYNHVDTSFGFSIAAGDLDEDGYRDIAASFAVDTHWGWVSRVYVFTGNPLDTLVDMKIWTHDFISVPRILAMDINGDSVDDLIAASGEAGKANIYFGSLVDSQEMDAWMSDDNLPTIGFCSLANAGDVNTDGWEDLIIGSYFSRHGDVGGAAYIYFGGPGFGTGEHDPDVIIAGHGGGFGWQVGGGGDFNADGFDDVIVGAPDINSIYIYFGGDPMDTVEDVTFSDEEAHFLAESPIDLLAKENGAHAVFGSEYWPNGGTRPGKAYVLFGGENYDNIPDIEIIGRTDSSGLTSIGGARSTGDADHDGRDDFTLGAPAEIRPVGDEWSAGAVYFYRGGNVIDSIFDGWLEGEDKAVGCRLAPAGDFDGDGRSEFLTSNYASGNPSCVWLCKFTGVGIEESEEETALKLELSATVTQEAVRFYYQKPLSKEASLTIYDVSGALVRRWIKLTESSVQWNLRDELGRKVPSGVYTARLDIKDGGATARKVVVLR